MIYLQDFKDARYHEHKKKIQNTINTSTHITKTPHNCQNTHILQTPHITHLHTTKPTRTHSHTLQNKYGDKVTPLGRMKTCSLSVEETFLCTLKSAGWFQSTPSFLLNKNRGLSPQYYGGRNMTLTTHFHLVHGNKMSAALPALSYTLLRSTQERLCVSVIQLT